VRSGLDEHVLATIANLRVRARLIISWRRNDAQCDQAAANDDAVHAFHRLACT
jgi:hypothetical protein